MLGHAKAPVDKTATSHFSARFLGHDSNPFEVQLAVDTSLHIHQRRVSDWCLGSFKQ